MQRCINPDGPRSRRGTQRLSIGVIQVAIARREVEVAEGVTALGELTNGLTE